MTSYVMQDVVESGTDSGQEARPAVAGRPDYDDTRDAWFMGLPLMVAGVWWIRSERSRRLKSAAAPGADLALLAESLREARRVSVRRDVFTR